MQELQEYWRKPSKDEINELPRYQYEGPIRLVRSVGQYRRVIGRLKQESVLGFDTESRPSFRKNLSFPISLIQLATSSEVFIFQISQFELPRSLMDMMADPQVLKIGVAVHDDIRDLQEIHPFEAHGFVDLGKESRLRGIPTNGLRNLAANFLGVRISKGAQRSDWGRRALSEQQITYAATDAWVSREIYLRMQELGVFDQPKVVPDGNRKRRGSRKAESGKKAADRGLDYSYR